MDWVLDPVDDVELVRDIERVRSVGTEKKRIKLLVLQQVAWLFFQKFLFTQPGSSIFFLSVPDGRVR